MAALLQLETSVHNVLNKYLNDIKGGERGGEGEREGEEQRGGEKERREGGVSTFSGQRSQAPCLSLH